ncbi:MAG: hypothetical protein Q9227_000916 [Pyrenula ochraceoflavens]
MAQESMSKSMSMQSRVGRDNQRWGSNGERLVAGVVPLSSNKEHVLIIQTRRGGWVLPKGGWELDEPTAAAAACREAWEEAGIICQVTRNLGFIQDPRTPSQLQKLAGLAPKALYQFFECSVKEQRDDWPEKSKRSRQWVRYSQAREAMRDRPELLEALDRSSIKK